MQQVVLKVLKPENMVFDPCIVTGVTEKVFLLKPKQSKLTGCDSECLRKMRPSLLEMFAGELLNEESNIAYSQEVDSTTETYLAKTAKDISFSERIVHVAKRSPCNARIRGPYLSVHLAILLRGGVLSVAEKHFLNHIFEPLKVTSKRV